MGINRITGLEEGGPKKPKVSLITGNTINEGGSPIQTIGANNMAVAGPELTDKEKFSNVLFHRDLTNEEVIDGRALAQDTSEKWKNGLAKAGVTFGGALAENSLGIGAGLLNVMTGGSFYDTPMGQWIDGANEAMQEAFPNYETIEQSKDPWDVWSANFWADKVANGIGYSLAAMASMAVPLFPIAGGARAIGLTRQSFLMSKQKAMINNLAKATSITKDGKAIFNEIHKTGKIGKILEEVQGGLYTGTLQAERILGAGMAEASVEARELKNQMALDGGDKLLEFKREQARKANPNLTDQELESITLNDEEVARIQSNAEMAGTFNYFANLAVVAGTQAIMFGKLVRGKNPNIVPKTRVKFDAEIGKFAPVKDSKALTFAKKLAGKEDLKGWEKLYIGVPTGSISEAGQEGLQFVSKKTYGDYYTRKNTGEEVGLNELAEAASEAVVSAFTTKEGIESMLIGAIVGGGTKSMVDAVDFLRRKGKKEAPGNASEQLATKLNDMEDILYGLSKGDGNRELSNVQLAIAKDMEKAHNEGDTVGAGYLYSQLIAANTLQAIKSNSYDAVRARINDTREMTDEEFSKFFDLNKELTQEEKGELVDSVLKNMDENKEIYETIQRKFNNKTFKSGIVDGIIKKANPEFYSELEIWNAEMDHRKQNLYEGLVSRRNILANYEKMNEALTNSAATNYRKGKVEGVTRKTTKDEDETAIIEDLAKNAPLDLTNTIYDKATISELKKEFPAAYQTLIDLYKQKNPKAVLKNSVKTEDIQELLEEFSENPEFLDAITKLQNIDPKLDPMYFNYAANIIQLAAIEAQLEFDYAMLNNDEITESLIAEDIKRKEATIKAVSEQVRGKENLSQINDRFKKDPTYQTAITDFNEELPEGATEKQVTDHYNKAIQHYKDIIDLVSEEEDYKYKASVEVYATKKINELEADKAKYLKELKENKDTNSGISLKSVDVLSKLIQNENYPQAEENFAKLSPLSNKEILDGLEVRLETWKGKEGTRPNDRQDGKIVQRYGVPGTNLGVYVYHNGNLIGGLMHPDAFTYNGQPFNYNSPQQMELLGGGLVETNSKGEKTFTEEGNAIRDFHIAITRAFVGVSEEGDTINSEAIQKLFKLHSKRWINNTETPVQSREKLSEFMGRAFNKYKFDVGRYSNIWVVQDSQEFHAVYEDGTIELIEDNETLKEIRTILNSDEFGTQTKLYNTVKAIIKNGDTHQYIAMNYNQVDTTAGKDILANMISRIKELESLTEEERKIPGKEKALINTGTDKKVFFTTNRASGESVDIYLDASAFLNKDGSLKPKVVVKMGDSYIDFYFNLKVRNGKLIYGKYERNPDGSTKTGSLQEAEVTSIEDLTEAINDTIQSYVAKKPEEYSKLAELVVYGLKESAKDNLLNNRVAGVPGFNFYFRPYNTPNTNQANAGKPKEMSAKRRKQIEDALKTTNETIAVVNNISDRNLASRLTEIMASKLRQEELSEFPKALGRLQELLKYASEVEEEPINIEEFREFVAKLEVEQPAETTETTNKPPAEITPSTIFGTPQQTSETTEPAETTTEKPSNEIQEAKKSARAKVVTKRKKPVSTTPTSPTPQEQIEELEKERKQKEEAARVLAEELDAKEKEALQKSADENKESLGEHFFKLIKEYGENVSEAAKDLQSAIKKGYKKLLMLMAVVGTLGVSSYTLSQYSVDDLSDFAYRGAVKYGLIQDTNEAELDNTTVKFETVEEVNTEEQVAPEDIGKVTPKFEVIRTVVDRGNNFWSYRNTWNNEEGFEYIASPSNATTKKHGDTTFTNALGVGHHLIMRYKATDLTDRNSKKDIRDDSNKRLKEFKDSDYVPFIELLPNNRVKLSFKKGAEVKSMKMADNQFTPLKLRQEKVSDLNFNDSVPSAGFKASSDVKSITTKKDGKSYNSLSFFTKKSYGRFSGGSVVLLFENEGNLVVHEFAGSVAGIENEINGIKNQFNLEDSDITLGIFDAASYTGKSYNKGGKLSTKQWSGFNPDNLAGSALLIPNSALKINKNSENEAPFSLTKKGTEVNLEEVRNNTRKILGDSVPLEVVDGIAERLGLKGISASRFINGVIQLDRYAEKGTEYHEAFHAVFRTMLSNSEIAEMYKAARKKYGRFTSAQKKSFIAQEPNSRSKMDSNELTNLWFEEKLADEFKDYMNSKTPSTKGFIARMFERILNFLKSLTGTNKDVITTLFDSMAKGEFVNAPQKYNVFRGNTDPAYTLLKTETDTDTNINRPLHRTESNRIIADISSRLYTKITNSGGIKYNSPEYKKLVAESISDAKEYYSIGDEENPGNWDKELDAYADLIFESDPKATVEEKNRAFFEKADPIMKMFNAIPYVDINEEGVIVATEENTIAQSNLDIILEEVKDTILFKMGVEVSSESYTEDEQEEQVIGESWSKAAYENGGYDRIGDKLKAIIQFSSAPLDEFGFGPSIIEITNQKYHRPLHNTVIYNSIVRSLIDTPKDQMLSKFKMFTEGNSETRKFFEHMSNIIAREYNNKMKQANTIKQNKFFEEITSLDVQNADEAFSVELAEHSDTLQVFQSAGKGTVLREVDVLNDPTKGNMLTSYASMRKLEDIQIKQWRNRFLSQNIDANTAVKSFSRILEYYVAFDPKNMGKSLEDFRGNVKRIAREFKQMGIVLSPTYIKYSLLKDNYKALNEGRRVLDKAGNTEGVEQITEFIKFVDTFSEIPSINDGLNVSDVKSPLVRLNQFANSLVDKRLFIYQFIDDSEGEGSSYDVTSRLLRLAEGNMAFDENITPTTYTNMEGKMVQSYTGSFYYSEQIAKLKDNSPGKFRDFMFGDNGLLSIKEKYEELEAIPEEELNNLYDKLEQASIAVKNPLYNTVQIKSTLALLFHHPYIVQGSELFNYYLEILKIGQNGGGRNKSLAEQEDGSIKEQRARTEGVQYSSMTTRDKILYHAAIYKLQKTVKKGENTVTQGNVMFGVNAEKSRQYHITAPIFDFTTEKSLSKDMVKQMFKAEVANIYLNNQGNKPRIKGVTYTTDGSLPNIQRFHTMNTKDEGINASLADIAKLATTQSLTQIIADPNNTIDEEFIDDLVQRIMDSKFNDFLQLLDKHNVINIKENEITTGVLPLKYIINPQEARGKVDIKTLNNWFLNDFINAVGTNSLINLSTHLTSTKGAADYVKRFPTGSAQGNDMGSGNTDIIIFKSVEKNGIDTTDGIGKSHIGWFINTFLKAEGTSDSKTLGILNNVRKGKKLTDSEYEYLYEKKAVPQSMKLQGNTALMALKMSVANILRSSVSYTEDQDTVDQIYDLIAQLEINSKWGTINYNGKDYTKEDLFEVAHDLFKPIPGSEDFHKLLNRMELENIGMAIADSAVKKSQIDAEELNDANVIYQFPNEYIRKQVESSGMKKEGIHPVQLQQLITSEIAKNAEIFIDGIKNSGEQTKALYKKLLSQRVTTGFAEKKALLIDKFGKETYEYMLTQFQRTLSEMGASPYVEEMFSAKDSSMFEPKNDLNFPSIVSKFEALYISFFDKNVFKHYTNGSKFVLVPDYNYQILTLNGKNISRDQYRAIKNKSKVKSRELAHRVKDGNGNFYSEVIVSEAFAKLFGLKIGEKIPENLLKFFGVRIPTQDKHSMINMKVVDFLDSAMGNTIIAPHQLVEISGWDFDIDSVYAQTLAGYTYKGEHIAYGNYLKTGRISDARQEYLAHLRDNNVIVKNALKEGTDIEQIIIKEEKQLPKFDSKQVEKNIKAYKAGNINDVVPITQSELNNMIMNIQIGLLHNDKNEEIAETPATRAIMETLKEMYRAAGIDPVGDLTEAFSLANKIDLDAANATGAENIGVAATFNTMFQYFAGKDFKGDFKLFGQKGFKVNINDDGWILDAKGRRINDYISQLVTAMTDAGKHNDPAFFNITKSTLSIIALAMASGKTIEFGIHLVNQPIIKDYIIETSANNDKLTRTSVSSKDDIISALRRKYNIGQEISDISGMDIKVAEQTLFDNINTPTPEVQKYALEEFIKADDISSALINFTQVTSLLKGRSASFGEVSNLRQSIENLESKEFPFDINDTLEDNPHLDTLIKMMNSTREIDKRFVTLENEVPVQLMQIVRKQLNAFNMRTANGEATVRKHLQAFLTMKAMAHKKGHKYGMDLLFDPTLTNNIRTLLGTFEFEKNLFLNSLDIDKKSEYKEGTFAGLTYYNINMNTRSAEESEAAEKIIDHFVALRYSSNPLAQEVAEQLLEFLLIKDGFLFLNNSFVNKVEPALLSAMGVFEVTNSIRHLFSETDKSLTYDNTFGMSKEKLMTEFITSFVLYTGNKNLANKIRFPEKSNISIGDTVIKIDEKAKRMNEVKGFVRRPNGEKSNFTVPLVFNKVKDPLIYKLTKVVLGNETYDYDALNGPRLLNIIDKEGNIMADSMVYTGTMVQGSKQIFNYYLNQAELDSYIKEKKASVKTAAKVPVEESNTKRYYEGNITPSPNTIFVFGSNPEGRHGAGAAKIARQQFGAIYGQGEGLQGNAYALPTKDLRVKENKGFKSISKDAIQDSIYDLYITAFRNPDKQFKIAYRNTTETSLNGYTGLEMIEMFNEAATYLDEGDSIPSNIIFSKEWFDTGKLNITEKVEKKGTSKTPAKTKTNKTEEFYNSIMPFVEVMSQFNIGDQALTRAEYLNYMQDSFVIDEMNKLEKTPSMADLNNAIEKKIKCKQ